MKQPIELRKLRDFGQIINDSFAFLKDNFKPLFKALIVICGVFVVLSAATTAFAFMNMKSLYRFDANSYASQGNTITYVISLALNAFVVILTQSFIHMVAICYISVYIQKNNATPTLPEVWGYFKYYFFRAIGSSILLSFIFLIALMLCVIPGIYMFPILSLVIPIMIIENASFSYAFNKSFRIIKKNWWMVFGVLFIMSLIVGIASSIASFPVTILNASGKFFSLNSYRLPLIIIFSVLKSVILLAYVLPTIGMSLCYFNLSEEKDGTGLLDRIDKLGKTDTDQSSLPAEEY